MAQPTLTTTPDAKTRSDAETSVLSHVATNADRWVSDGQLGIVSGQVEDAERRVKEAIVIAARVKQMDPTGWLEACGARASGLTIVGEVFGANAAVAYLLNNLEPAEANSLAGGTDVTDRAITRAKNKATLAASTDFDRHLESKIKGWEESHDHATWKFGADYMPRVPREVEVARRTTLTQEQRVALGPLYGPAKRRVINTLASAKAILAGA